MDKTEAHKQPITVKDLRAVLEQMPQDAHVLLGGPTNWVVAYKVRKASRLTDDQGKLCVLIEGHTRPS